MLRRVEFYNEVVTLITGDQGIDYVNETPFLDDERVKNICRVISCQGGTDANKTRDFGHKISLKAG